MGSGTHSRIVGDKRHVWFVTELWERGGTLPVVELDPKTIIDLTVDGWFSREKPTPERILAHMRRILDADLQRPVILAPDGTIMDGAHRACKAILLGKARISTVKFPEMPPPSVIEDPLFFSEPECQT